MFWVLMLVGLVGFFAMTGLSFVHAGGGGHGHHAGFKTLHGHGHGGHAPLRHGAAPHQGSRVHLGMLLSPLDLFSLALGCGATGTLLTGFVPASWLWPLAILGGLAFDFAVVKPIMSALLRFATSPSEGLEGMVAHTAEAITGFDREGRGLVRLALDGQVVQLLATLDPAERMNGVSVAKGDELVVTEVDPKRNTCRVTRELSS